MGLLGVTGSNVTKDLHHNVMWAKFSALLLCRMLGQILVWSYSKTTPEPIQLVTLINFFGQTTPMAHIFAGSQSDRTHMGLFIAKSPCIKNINNVAGLQAAIRCECNALPMDLIRRLTGSML